MKKICLCFTTSCLFLMACGSKVSYSSLIKKLKSFSGEVSINNSYLNGYYTEEGFFTKGDSVVLYLYGDASHSETHVYITLPNSTKAPNNYSCVYGWTYPSQSYTEAAIFYISNNYSHSSSVSFSKFNGYSDGLESAQNLAKSSINLLIVSFDNWLYDEYNYRLKDVGMFPRF